MDCDECYCGSNTICEGGVCTEQCDCSCVDDECPPCHSCDTINDVCEWQCTTGQVCCNDVCTTGDCCANADCDTGFICDNNVCTNPASIPCQQACAPLAPIIDQSFIDTNPSGNYFFEIVNLKSFAAGRYSDTGTGSIRSVSIWQDNCQNLTGCSQSNVIATDVNYYVCNSSQSQCYRLTIVVPNLFTNSNNFLYVNESEFDSTCKIQYACTDITDRRTVNGSTASVYCNNTANNGDIYRPYVQISTSNSIFCCVQCGGSSSYSCQPCP